MNADGTLTLSICEGCPPVTGELERVLKSLGRCAKAAYKQYPNRWHKFLAKYAPTAELRERYTGKISGYVLPMAVTVLAATPGLAMSITRREVS